MCGQFGLDRRTRVLLCLAGTTDAASVIGNDLKIIGQGLKIIGRGLLKVDGEIEGDVQAVEVIVGERGKVTSMVAGQQVVVRGKVARPRRRRRG
jgi:cytoskeletal protein CcmA (bactofilin family)